MIENLKTGRQLWIIDVIHFEPTVSCMRIVVLDAGTIQLEDSAWDRLRTLGDLILHEKTDKTLEAITERCQGATVVLTNKVPMERCVMEALPDLKLISALATGYNLIDVLAAKEQGIVVNNVPAYSTDAVAQHTLSLILAFTNRVSEHTQSVHSGDWVRSPYFWYATDRIVELSDLTVGIVGFGEIGRRVGALLHALGARVIVHTRTERDRPDWDGFAYVSQDELFAQSDVVTLHCPLTATNAGFVNADSLKRMKPGAFLINTSRGPLVNERDLAHALNEGIIAGAGLDVVSVEPMAEDCPLLGAKNCLITPHIGWASERARKRLLHETAENIQAFLDGKPRNVVS